MRPDLRGRRLGKLLVLEQGENVIVGKSAMAAWRCRCACGRIVTLATYRLTRPDHATHCGCRSGRELPAAFKQVVEDLPEKTTSSAEYLRRVHDNGGIGALRVVGRSVEDDDDETRCLTTTGDPWN